MATVDIDMSGFREFFERLEQAAEGDFRKDLELFLEGVGEEFLRIVEEEIISRKAMDTRAMLHSFHRGGDGNVWELDGGGLILEVGSSVEYAQYVNDGHAQRPGRFIPGYWNGDRFVYSPGAKTGMVLKAKWVEGKHYYDAALRIIEKMMPDLLEAKLEQWIDSYFS